MTATRRGIDRITTRSLRQCASDAALAIKNHLAICPRCKVNEYFPRDCCDDGWKLYKAGKRADNDLTVYLGVNQEGNGNGQGTLW